MTRGLDVLQGHLAGTNCKYVYKRAINSIAFTDHTHFVY